MGRMNSRVLPLQLGKTSSRKMEVTKLNAGIAESTPRACYLWQPGLGAIYARQMAVETRRDEEAGPKHSHSL